MMSQIVANCDTASYFENEERDAHNSHWVHKNLKIHRVPGQPTQAVVHTASPCSNLWG